MQDLVLAFVNLGSLSSKEYEFKISISFSYLTTFVLKNLRRLWRYLKEILIFSFEDKEPRFTRLKPDLALRLLSKGLFFIRAMQQTKMLVTCQRFDDLFYLGWSGSTRQIRTNIIKVGSKSWLLTRAYVKSMSFFVFSLVRHFFVHSYYSIFFDLWFILSENVL